MDESEVHTGLHNNIVRSINNGFAYLFSNAWAILFLLAAGYYFKTHGASQMERVMGTQEKKDAQRRQDMERVRQQQQLRMEERAKLAKKLAEANPKQVEDKPVEKKKPKKTTKANSTNKDGFKPLQPIAGHGYRPARRTVRRG